jgi:hypothetical protein
MDTHRLPNDVISNLDPFALLIFIPACDLIVTIPHSILNVFLDKPVLLYPTVLSCPPTGWPQLYCSEEDYCRVHFGLSGYDMGCSCSALYLQGIPTDL